jgi:hypothetical protein
LENHWIITSQYSLMSCCFNHWIIGYNWILGLFYWIITGDNHWKITGKSLDITGDNWKI